MNTPNGWSLSSMMNFIDTECGEDERRKQLTWLVLISVQNKDKNLNASECWWEQKGERV